MIGRKEGRVSGVRIIIYIVPGDWDTATRGFPLKPETADNSPFSFDTFLNYEILNKTPGPASVYTYWLVAD